MLANRLHVNTPAEQWFDAVVLSGILETEDAVIGYTPENDSRSCCARHEPTHAEFLIMLSSLLLSALKCNLMGLP